MFWSVSVWPTLVSPTFIRLLSSVILRLLLSSPFLTTLDVKKHYLFPEQHLSEVTQRNHQGVPIGPSFISDFRRHKYLQDNQQEWGRSREYTDYGSYTLHRFLSMEWNWAVCCQVKRSCCHTSKAFHHVLMSRKSLKWDLL